MSRIILDPVCLIGVSTYHEKNCPRDIGASYGILYARQSQLTYQISMAVPLGTHLNTAQQLTQRMVEYDSLKVKKSKQSINFLDEFVLLGWYVMGTPKYTSQKKYFDVLSKELQMRGAPYSLILDPNANEEPKLYKSSAPEQYSATLQQLEKICSDSMNLQKSQNISPIVKSITKHQEILSLYNEKLNKLKIMLEKNELNNQQKRKIRQSLELYERIHSHNNHKKQTTIQYINYSVLEGLILSKNKLKDL